MGKENVQKNYSQNKILHLDEYRDVLQYEVLTLSLNTEVYKRVVLEVYTEMFTRPSDQT